MAGAWEEAVGTAVAVDMAVAAVDMAVAVVGTVAAAAAAAAVVLAAMAAAVATAAAAAGGGGGGDRGGGGGGQGSVTSGHGRRGGGAAAGTGTGLRPRRRTDRGPGRDATTAAWARSQPQPQPSARSPMAQGVGAAKRGRLSTPTQPQHIRSFIGSFMTGVVFGSDWSLVGQDSGLGAAGPGIVVRVRNGGANCMQTEINVALFLRNQGRAPGHRAPRLDRRKTSRRARQCARGERAERRHAIHHQSSGMPQYANALKVSPAPAVPARRERLGGREGSRVSHGRSALQIGAAVVAVAPARVDRLAS